MSDKIICQEEYDRYVYKETHWPDGNVKGDLGYKRFTFLDGWLAAEKAMQEKMKCCQNCKSHYFDECGIQCKHPKNVYCKFCDPDNTEDYWELKKED
jgi:hypothetical protein